MKKLKPFAAALKFAGSIIGKLEKLIPIKMVEIKGFEISIGGGGARIKTPSMTIVFGGVINRSFTIPSVELNLDFKKMANYLWNNVIKKIKPLDWVKMILGKFGKVLQFLANGAKGTCRVYACRAVRCGAACVSFSPVTLPTWRGSRISGDLNCLILTVNAPHPPPPHPDLSARSVVVFFFSFCGVVDPVFAAVGKGKPRSHV